jgi:hypothetical protein
MVIYCDGNEVHRMNASIVLEWLKQHNPTLSLMFVGSRPSITRCTPERDMIELLMNHLMSVFICHCSGRMP